MHVELVFETHSTSVDNERGLASGWLDAPLSARGRDQALALGTRHRDDGLAAVFTSDLVRAVETAAIAFAGSPVPVHRDWRLRECNYGELNGARVPELEPRKRFVDVPFPSGESYRDVARRVASFLGELEPYDGMRVLVIGHSATRWSLEHLIDGMALEALVEAPFAWREGWIFRYAP
jgi:2,3-bisphosphoglycerate-dependent phosphoglycerate mutase